MKKVFVLFIVTTILLTGCYSGSGDATTETEKKSRSKNFFDVSTSHFDHYKSEQSDTAYTIKGTVSQENDGNAVLVYIHAEKDVAVSMTGTMERISGGDTQLVYIAPDGMETELVDNSAEKIDSTINISTGKSAVKFIGESAVYDFDVTFGLADGVSYGDV